MKTCIKKGTTILSLLTLFLSCSKDDTSTQQPQLSSFTAYQNQLEDDADALQAQYISPDNTINLYGVFDADKNPTEIHTITYQKKNSDTVVNMVLEPFTKRISSLFTTINGQKSDIIMKFDYISTTDLNVSFHKYDWSNNTSENIFSTHLNPEEAANRMTIQQRLGGAAFNIGALAVGISAAEIVAAIGGGWSAIATLSAAGSALIAGASATAIVGAAAIAATLIFANGVGATTVDISNLPPPSNTILQNPVIPANNPAPNLQTPLCFNNNISFQGTMDSVGNIAISGVSGGVFPYKYLVGSQLQENPVFPNQYPDGSYLLGVKDANGCMSVKVIPLDRVLDGLTGTWTIPTSETSVCWAGATDSYVFDGNGTFSRNIKFVGFIPNAPFPYVCANGDSTGTYSENGNTYNITSGSYLINPQVTSQNYTDEIIGVTATTITIKTVISTGGEYVKTYTKQ